MQISSSGNTMMQHAIMTAQHSPMAHLSSARLYGDDAALMAAAQEFETHFIQQLFRAMRNTVNTENSLIPRTQTEEIFQDFIDEMTARNTVVGGSGFGLAQQIFNQVRAQQTPLQTELLAQTQHETLGEYGIAIDEE